MSRRAAAKKGAAKAVPASLIPYRVTFDVVTTIEVFIKAPNADAAMQIAKIRWDHSQRRSFARSQKLRVVSNGIATRDYQAEEVPL